MFLLSIILNHIISPLRKDKDFFMTQKNDTIVITKVPKKNRILMAILFTKILIILAPIRWYILKHLPNCQNIDFVPGFRFLYGNIYARNCHLCDTFFVDYAPIYIGENTKFSFDNIIITSSHEKNDFTRVYAKPVYIGRNVWITSRCVILGGVKIGNNSIIAAGSVVSKDIPSNCIAAGNPAKVVKHV